MSFMEIPNPKSQTPNPKSQEQNPRTKSQTNSNPKPLLKAVDDWAFSGFGIWNLGFGIYMQVLSTECFVVSGLVP
jgi:hypothetical protein